MAGKTFTNRLAMDYIRARSEGSMGAERNLAGEAVAEVLSYSNPILEAMGNAKTTRNNNSSRFGKYTRIIFSKSGVMRTVQISTYLLEAIRVASIASPERNYHIFYMVMAAMARKPELWNEIAGSAVAEATRLPKDVAGVHYLTQSECLVADGWDDNEVASPVESDPLRSSPSPTSRMLRLTPCIPHSGCLYAALLMLHPICCIPHPASRILHSTCFRSHCTPTLPMTSSHAHPTRPHHRISTPTPGVRRSFCCL